MVAYLIILIIHWFADFVMHIWYVVGMIYALTHLDSYVQWHATFFFIITFICHTVTDYFTSRLNSRLWHQAQFWRSDFGKALGTYAEAKADRYTWKFFVSIGFDQILHFTQLFITYKLLT